MDKIKVLKVLIGIIVALLLLGLLAPYNAINGVI
jgi:hypothetical protein